MKKILIIFIILLTACAKADIPGYTDGAKFKEEYEALNNKGIVVNINQDANIKYLEIEEVIDLLENKTGIIYFGFPNCPWCRNIIPILLDVAKANNQALYYFNPKDVRGTEDENFAKIMEILNQYLEVNEEGKKVLYVPDVYFVKNGEIIGHHLGSVTTQTNPYEPLTEQQKNELISIYSDLIIKMEE